jgi:hypothetical protein
LDYEKGYVEFSLCGIRSYGDPCNFTADIRWGLTRFHFLCVNERIMITIFS